MNTRQYSFFDHLLIQIDLGLSTVFASSTPLRANPADQVETPYLSTEDQKKSAAMMRINHCGEVCAQALYQGQSLVARNQDIKQTLQQAASEETDHLAWTKTRIEELQSHTSYLNIIWYAKSFVIGVLAGLAGDRWSLGFIEETEAQVFAHLAKHLGELPEHDYKSRAIVTQMQIDEKHHGTMAHQAGAQSLPRPIKQLMAYQAKVMTTVVYWI